MGFSRSEDFYIRKLFQKVLLREIMSTPPIVVKINDHFSRVVELFQNKRIRHLPVVNQESLLVGLITERDLYQIQSPRHLEDGSLYYDPEVLNAIEIYAVMRKDPFFLHPDDTLAKAIAPMVDHKYGCIPIVSKEKKIEGIITQYDLLKMIKDVLAE